MHFIFVMITSLGFFGSAFSQFPPAPQDVKTLKSKYDKSITISYKEVSQMRLPTDYLSCLTTHMNSLEYVKRLQESSRMLATSICHPARFRT